MADRKGPHHKPYRLLPRQSTYKSATPRSERAAGAEARRATGIEGFPADSRTLRNGPNPALLPRSPLVAEVQSTAPVKEDVVSIISRENPSDGRPAPFVQKWHDANLIGLLCAGESRS